MQFIAKTRIQSKSLIITIPSEVVTVLDLKPDTILTFDVKTTPSHSVDALPDKSSGVDSTG